jgi:lipid A disaccharide synthetase
MLLINEKTKYCVFICQSCFEQRLNRLLQFSQQCVKKLNIIVFVVPSIWVRITTQ